jgi:4-hydroxybutyrate dehydrogenase/sulfolactaldehyde 3-reductase
MATKDEIIGFIGLGAMGRGMASNCVRKGFRLVVNDVRPEPMDALVALGAAKAGSIAEVARQCSIIITVLPTGREVHDVVMGPGGIFDNAASGTLVLDLSTIDPETTDKLHAEAARRGFRAVDAPIGRLAWHAERGESLFMVGAEPEDFERVRPLLEAMGSTIHHCGPGGAGTRTKLVNNFLAISLTQLNAEALALSQRFGLDLNKTLDVIHGTTATNGQLKINFPNKVLAGDTEPGFTIGPLADASRGNGARSFFDGTRAWLWDTGLLGDGRRAVRPCAGRKSPPHVRLSAGKSTFRSLSACGMVGALCIRRLGRLRHR